MQKTYPVIAIIVLTIMLGQSPASVSGPYEVDEHTLRLYHFDGNAQDAVPENPIHLTLVNSASVVDDSYPGFGQALNTYNGLSGDPDSPIALTDQNVSGSNFVGPDGAFTFEAIISPAVSFAQIGNDMQMITGEADQHHNRSWQFRINTNGFIHFIKIDSNENFIQNVPTSGPHAYEPGRWYHVAVAYTGQADTEGNLKFYWTALDVEAEQANELASFRMSGDLDSSREVVFSVGGSGRTTFGYYDNFEGLIDQVRISSIARQADDFIFAESAAPVVISEPAEVVAAQGQQAVFEAVFATEHEPQASWFFRHESGDIALDSTDENISVELVPDGPGQYRTTLIIDDLDRSHAGQYFCTVSDQMGWRNTAAAWLRVKGLVAHWPLGQAYYIDSAHTDIAGGHDMQSSQADFTTGADGSEASALLASGSDWPGPVEIDPVQGTAQMTVSLWAKKYTVGQSSAVLSTYPQQDITAELDPADNSQWQHYCAVFDGESALLYINGQEQARGDYQLPVRTEARLNLGAMLGGYGGFEGALDDVRVYNYALSKFQVADLYYQTTGRDVCILDYASEFDLSGPGGVSDCKVGVYDLAVLAQQWLQTYDCTDYARMAGQWLSCGLYPSCY